MMRKQKKSSRHSTAKTSSGVHSLSTKRAHSGKAEEAVVAGGTVEVAVVVAAAVMVVEAEAEDVEAGVVAVATVATAAIASFPDSKIPLLLYKKR
jgi:hypothetical protein